jgi:hypothetical protein
LGKGCISRGEEERVKEKMVEIQKELQIGREKGLWILLQAPLEMKG